MRIAYINKKFIPLKEANVSILDRGLLYGDGAFETMRSYEGIVFHIEKHIDRLNTSLKILQIKTKISKIKLKEAVYRLLDKNKLKNAYIKIIVTRGKQTGLLAPIKGTDSTVMIYVLPYKKPKKSIYNKGIRVSIVESQTNEKSVTIGNKTLNYLHNVLTRLEAKKEGFDDAILVNQKGIISEATSSNIFIVKNGNLLTPSLDSGILPGITREEVIGLMKKKVKECFISKVALFGADEVFLTNSLMEIVPVVKINNRKIGNGKPGEVTKSLMETFKSSVKEYCKKNEK